MRRIGSFIWGKIYVLLFRPLYWLENTASLWPLVNREAVSHFKKHARTPNAVEQRIIDELKKNGIAKTSLEEFFGNGDALLFELVSFSDEKAKSAKPHPVKSFVKDFFDPIPTVEKKNPFARLALDERVLTVTGSYLGMSPKLQEFALAEISAVPEGANKIGSMRWHRDPHDRRLLKMFIYLNDVGMRNGPFNYILRSNAGNEFSTVFPQLQPAGIYPPDGEVEKRIDSRNVYSSIGSAGTVVFADTAGLHAGGFVLEDRRRMSTIGYLPPKSFLVRQMHYKKEPGEILSPLQEFAISGSEYLFSRELFKTLKGTLMGKKSIGTHVTGMMP